MGGETEEERRRREEEEARQQSGGLDLAGIANRYVDQRLGQVDQRMSDIGQLYNDPGAALEQRLSMTPEQAGNTEVQSQTVKTYADGSQEEVTKKQIPSQTVEQPVAPTAPVAQPMAQAAPAPAQPVAPGASVGQPAAPAQTAPAGAMTMDDRIAAAAQRAQERAAGGGQPPAPVAQQPVAQPAPQAPAPQAQQQITPINPNIGQLPQPGPGVQVAGPTQMPPEAMPSPSVGNLQQVAQQASQTSPWTAALESGKNDITQLGKILASDAPEDIKSEAQDRLFNMKADTVQRRKAEELVSRVESGDPKAINDLSRELKSRSEEGSLLKAYMYTRLGLNKLAEEEQMKLGGGTTYSSFTGADGLAYTVRVNGRGGVEKAFDASGRAVDPSKIAELNSAFIGEGKSYLMPSSIGGLMQKTIIGEDGKPTVITGAVVRDPRNPKSVYFEANGKRYDTTGLSTPAQNIPNVYGAAGAKQQGSQAAQTGVDFVGGQGGGQVVGGDQEAARKAALDRAQGDVAGSDREIQRLSRLPDSDPTKQQRIGIITQERNAAQQRVQQLSGPIPGGAAGQGGIASAGGAGGQRPGENFLQYQERLKREGAEAQAATEANIALGKEERSNFLTYEEKEIVPKADAAGSIASTRKSQLKGPDGILSNPEIVGMMQGQGGAASEVGNIIRDLITGEKDNEDLSRRVAALGLTQRQKDVLYNQIGLNRQIAPKTLKENAGAGSVSDAEQKANREAAVDVTRVPLYTAVTLLSKDQFDKDQSVARAAFRQANPGLTTVRAFNDAWGKEKNKLDNEYNQIYAARAQYISKYYNGGQNPGAIVDAYKHYPVPEFNRQTGTWDYGTDYARKAARPKISSFER